MIVDSTPFANPDNFIPLWMHSYPFRCQLVLLAFDHLTERLVIGDIPDQVERHSVAFASHKGVFDQIYRDEKDVRAAKSLYAEARVHPKKVSFRGEARSFRSISPSMMRASSSALKI